MADPLITTDPDGRPMIAGTQVTVKEVLKELAAWGSVDRVLTAHSELDRDKVQAALVYAAEVMHKMASAPPEQPSPEEEHFVPRADLANRCGRCIRRLWKNSVHTMNRCLTRKASVRKCASGAENATLMWTVDPHVEQIC